ncbi:OLC1v1012011C1 [Oldenlandia corymbosa var. corymbosa]|uniref:OLC1v1012011C1 n=1 Tax=Oldenlandia corymbosa var. corymbosa TaxID=529605 RepID=A0AAV1DUZ8_OLDCO|nr:OLC1v1012011C1 [Oldenlandia corymbosa var. corymbosa]
MAMPSAGAAAAAVPSAQVVGNAFVEQYYHILHRSPELVYKFYQDASILSRPDSDGTMTSVTTMLAINEKIQSFDYKNYKAEIKTADAQDSYQAGVIVLVTGCLTGTDNVRRKFTQTFFLAPQEKGYFVLNDVFRYVEESEPSEVNSVLANGAADNVPVTTPLTSDPEPGHAPDRTAFDSVNAAETDEAYNGPEVCDPSDNEDGSVVEVEPVNEPPPKTTEVEFVQGVGPDSSATLEEKKSYASIVKVTKSATRTTPVYVPTSSARTTAVNANQQARRSEKSLVETQAPAPAVESGPESSNVHEEGYSIYVRNLALNATAQQLEEEFKKFGPIKHDGVQVRSNKQGSCFGFVEFESLESMENAIKASPINIGGRQAVVEEKRTNTRVGSSGRGRYTSGSGGYRSESFRGRGNYGGGRGYGRSEFRNQGEFSSRPKGSGGRNVETYQRVDHSGSGRFSRSHQSQGAGSKGGAATSSS